MSDLCERLRSLVILDEVGSNNPLGREAADEIASLRAQLASADALAKLNQTQLSSALDSGEAWKCQAEKAEAQLASARKALEEIAAIGSKITDPKNIYGIQMGNIAHAAHIETALSDEEGKPRE